MSDVKLYKSGGQWLIIYKNAL
ncbi:MAG: KxYKxGKxW signal peptide domain-containing protein [Halanaerobiaceae bacterium]